MNKREFNKRLKAIGERIKSDPMKPQQNRLNGPYRLVLQVPQDVINDPDFQKLVKPEEIGVPQFYDTLDEARSVLRLVKAVFPGVSERNLRHERYAVDYHPRHGTS
jgi:hypothetical protein